MLPTAIIVFREVLEAALIVGVVLAASRGVPARGRWVCCGIAAGILGAMTVAAGAGEISTAIDGMGQELFDAAILFSDILILPWALGHGLAFREGEGPVLPKLRATFAGCPGATDIAILPYDPSTKAFIACSGGHQVMAVALAQPADSWAVKQNPSLAADHMLALLDVGKTPVQLTLKPDGGQVFSANFDSDSISAIDTESDEVTRTDTIADGPVRGVIGSDDSTLWIANFNADSINLWSVDDSQPEGGVRTGRAPDALAFSRDEHLLLAADAHSGDVSVIRTQDRNGPELFTLLPAGAQPNDIVVKAMQGKP